MSIFCIQLNNKNYVFLLFNKNIIKIIVLINVSIKIAIKTIIIQNIHALIIKANPVKYIFIKACKNSCSKVI